MWGETMFSLTCQALPDMNADATQELLKIQQVSGLFLTAVKSLGRLSLFGPSGQWSTSSACSVEVLLNGRA